MIRSVPEHVNAKLYSFEKCFESYKKIEYATQILREMVTGGSSVGRALDFQIQRSLVRS